VEHEVKLDGTEMSMIRCIRRVTLKERKKSAELLFAFDPVSLVIKNSRSRWFGNVECKDDADWIKHSTMMEVDEVKTDKTPQKEMVGRC